MVAPRSVLVAATLDVAAAAAADVGAAGAAGAGEEGLLRSLTGRARGACVAPGRTGVRFSVEPLAGAVEFFPTKGKVENDGMMYL